MTIAGLTFHHVWLTLAVVITLWFALADKPVFIKFQLWWKYRKCFILSYFDMGFICGFPNQWHIFLMICWLAILMCFGKLICSFCINQMLRLRSQIAANKSRVLNAYEEGMLTENLVQQTWCPNQGYFSRSRGYISCDTAASISEQWYQFVLSNFQISTPMWPSLKQPVLPFVVHCNFWLLL